MLKFRMAFCRRRRQTMLAIADCGSKAFGLYRIWLQGKKTGEGLP